ncbi:hypothetical protein [Paenibacillus sp. P3E]|uniref:hypothetical protein n=1 Tax=Paenibacillus sp. P3E TaxID=1349435 RepID=UPI0015BA7FB3|nr:hypothetical protein [Paenibacillus sp. P3E]
MKIDIPATIGHLHLLWWWAMDNLPDGNLSVLEPEDIADEMMWSGDAAELLQALHETGFVDEVNGELFIHDWHDYIGRLLERRRKETERKREYRRKSQECPTGQDADDTRDGGGNSTVPYLNNNITTTGDDNLSKIDKAYARIHKCMGLKPKDWPEVNSLLNQNIPPDLIIAVMEEKNAKKSGDGGKINSFSFYTEAIKERAIGKSNHNTSRMALFDHYEEGA